MLATSVVHHTGKTGSEYISSIYGATHSVASGEREGRRVTTLSEKSRREGLHSLTGTVFEPSVSALLYKVLNGRK